MAFYVVSDQPMTEREEILQESMNVMAELDVRSMAIVGITGEGEVVCAYWKAGFQDRILMAGNIQMDALDLQITNNRERYFEESDEE